MRRVVVAIFPGVQALDVSGPLDVLVEANNYLPEGQGYVAMLASADGGSVRASSGMRIGADLAFAEAAGPWDIALVAGGPALPDAAANDSLRAWLKAVALTSVRYGSVCTGAFALGAAGLLNGKRVTTHWQSAGLLAQRFPLAKVEPDRIFCRDGALITSAGVTAGIDMALALVAEDHGAALALTVAKRLVVVAQRQGGQSQFSPYLVSAVTDPDDPMARVQAHVLANLRESLSVDSLAGVAGMSGRHFARVFAQAVDATPHEFIERARVDNARRLLESTSMPLKTVAWECGFASTDRMRLVFMRRLGVTPLQYRASFRRAG